MQQHPIPQNVMSVEFQLVGNLTLRQFGYLAIGGVLVFLLFLIPFADWLKWPLILLIGSFFASLAYLPINDITLDRWVVAFFRAINSPTKRVWRKEIKELSVLAQDYVGRFTGRSSNATVSADRSRLNEYLATLRAGQPQSDLDVAESAYLQSLPFDEGGPAPVMTTPRGLDQTDLASQTLPPTQESRTIEEDLTKPSQLTPAVRPIITVHMPNKNIYVKKVSTTTVNRQLHSLSSLEGTIVLPVRGEKTFEISDELKKRLYPELALAESATITPAPPVPIAPELPDALPEIMELPPVLPQAMPEPVLPQIPVPETSAPLPQTNVDAMEAKLAAEAEKTRQDLLAQKRRADEAAQAPKPPTSAAPIQAPKIEFTPKPQISGNLVVPNYDRPEAGPKVGTPPPQPIRKATPPTPSAAAPGLAVGKMAPQAANSPNVIVGLIRDQSGLLLTDVVIIVKDPDGEPVRALKSNKVGQFAISTPLPNGTYTIDLEKDGYKFDTIQINLDGQIFAPIEIKSR